MTLRIASRRTVAVLALTAIVLAAASAVALAAFTNTTRLTGTATADYVPPTLQLAPHVSGAATDGETLTALPGVWAGLSPSATRAYQWFGCSLTLTSCAAISGATGTSYVVPTGAVDTTRYVVRETVTNGTRTATAASIPSEAQAPGVVAILKIVTVTSAMPTISGSATVGGTLTSSTGTWTSRALIGDLLGLLTSSYAYQWLRCGPVGNTATPTVGGAGCTAIAGATSSTYQPVAADRGSRLRVRVTHTASVGIVIVVTVTVPFSGTVDTQATGIVP